MTSHKIIGAALLVVATLGGAALQSVQTAADDVAVRKLPLRQIVRAGGDVDFRMKITWCGPQDRPLWTTVLGTEGRPFEFDLFERTRIAKGNYANDSHAPRVSFHQLEVALWNKVIDRLMVSEVAKQANPEHPDGGVLGAHVVLARRHHANPGRRVPALEYAEFLVDSPRETFRGLFAEVIPESHPRRDAILSCFGP